MFAEDVATFFDTAAGFAQAVTVAGEPVSAIYDNGGAMGAVGMVGMASTAPSLTLATADVPANPVGEPVVVEVLGDPVTYLVAAHEPDGTGISRLLLESAT